MAECPATDAHLRPYEEHLLPTRDDISTAMPFTVTITHCGREFRVTLPMARIFLDHARTVIERDESRLVVLAHAAGVELLLVTPSTPLCAVDAQTEPATLLWDARRPVTVGDQVAAAPEPQPKPGSEPLHRRVLAATYPLVVHRGVKALSVGEIEAASGASRADIEREFGSRDELVRQCLQLRERQWTLGLVQAGARARGTTPESRLLAIFDVFDEWFHRDDYEACTFINVLVEMGKSHPLGRMSIKHLENIRDIVARLAQEANLREPTEFALSWHVLMKGSIMNATEGDIKAAIRAKEMARDLIARHRQAATASV
jgi:AcrR family transcriptional regulator